MLTSPVKALSLLNFVHPVKHAFLPIAFMFSPESMPNLRHGLQRKCANSKSAMAWMNLRGLTIHFERKINDHIYRTHGPLIHDRAVGKVKRHVDDAISRGASILVGGKHLEGNFYVPTVLSDVSPDSELTDEETFGPVAALIKFETEEEAIRLSNDARAGLAGYFFSRDIGRVWRVAEALEVGMVGANTGAISSAVMPFGGVKVSIDSPSIPKTMTNYMLLGEWLRKGRWSHWYR